MSSDKLRDELEQLLARLDAGVINTHVREVAGWLAPQVSSIAFDQRWEATPTDIGDTRFRKHPPQTSTERLREADLHDAWQVLNGVATTGRIPPNAVVRIRAALRYLPPAPQIAPPVPLSPARPPAPPDIVRRQVFQYRVLTQELGRSRSLVRFVHGLGQVRPIARDLADSCAARGLDGSAFERIVSADAEALAREHRSTRSDTRSDMVFSVADAMLPLLLKAIADEERSAPVPDVSVARMIDELASESLPALYSAAAESGVSPNVAWNLRSDRLMELAQCLELAAQQRAFDLGPFILLVRAVTAVPAGKIAERIGSKEVTAAFEALARLRDTPLPTVPTAPPPVLATKPSASPRLTIEQDNCVAVLDGVRYPVTANQAKILQQMLDARGGWVPSNLMKDYRDSSQRPGRWIKGLPAALRCLVKGKSGAGFRLIMPVE